MMKRTTVISSLVFFMLTLSSSAFAEALKDHIPGAQKFDALKTFVVEHVDADDDAVTVKGTFRGKRVQFVQTKPKKGRSFSIEAVGSALEISDIIPELKDFPGDDALRIEKVTFDENALTATTDGRVSDTELAITFDPKNRVATITPRAPDITLGSVLPSLKDVPVINVLIFEGITFKAKDSAVSVTGKVKSTAATLTMDLSKGPTNPIIDLTFLAGSALSDALPDLADVPLVGEFVLEDLHYDRQAGTVGGTGRIHKTEAVLILDTSKGMKNPVFNLKFEKGSAITDVLPDLADVPLVSDFILEDLSWDPRAKTVGGTGKIRKTEAVLTLDTAKGMKNPVFNLKFEKGSAITDVLPDLDGVPLVGDFILEDLNWDPRAKTVGGTVKIRATEATLSVDTTNGLKKPIFDLKIVNGLTLPQVLPDLADVPIVGDVTFNGLRFNRERKAVTISGDVGGKTVTLDIANTQGRVIDLKADKALGLANVVTELKGVPGIGDFGIKELTLKARAMSADLTFGTDSAKLSIDLSGSKTGGRFSAFNIVPDTNNLSIGRLFPELSGVPGIKDFNLTGLNFVEKTKALVSSISLGSGSGAKKATITSTSDPSKGKGRVFKLSSPHLSIADLVPSLAQIPMFGALKFDELDISATAIEATLDLGSASVELFASIKNGFAALDFGGLDIAALIPEAGKTALDGIRLAGSVFVVSTSPNVLPGDLPTDMLKNLGGVDVKTPFKAGISLLGSIRKEDLGSKLSGLFDTLSIKAPSFPVSGIFPKEVFDFIKQAKGAAKDAKHVAGDAKKEIVTAILDALDVTIDIPIPEIDVLKKFATFKTAHLSITGNSGDDPFWKNLPADMQKRKPTGRLDVSIRGGITLTLGGFDGNMKTPIELESLVDLNAGDGAKSVSLLGRVDGVWDKPFGIKGLTFEKSGFDIALSTGGSGAKATLDFFSAAKLHDKTDLSVDASFSESGGLPKLDYFVLDGPLALSDLAGKLPNADNFIVHEIKIYPDGIEAQVEAKNKLFDERTNLFMFELDAGSEKSLVAAIDLTFNAEAKTKQNFSLGRLAKIAGLKGEKSKIIQTNLDAMAVANAALILSSRKVFPLPPDGLKSGIAKDMFDGIFGSSKVPVKLDNVTFLSDFRADLMGEIGDKLVNGVKGVKLGLSEEAVINGTIGGLFDSDPLNLDLEFLLAESLSLDHLQQSGLKLPSFLKAKPKSAGGAEKIGIFLKVVDATFEVGLLAGFDMQYNDTAFDFTGTLGIQLAEEEIGLSLSGAMSDTWKNALGIQGFELENVVVAGEIEADPPSIKIGLGGDANLWGHDMSSTGDLMVGLAGEIPIPEGLGMKTTVSDLDVTMYEILNTVTILSSAEVVIDPPMWPIILVGVVGEVGLSEGYTIIYDKVKGKKVTAKDLAGAPFKDAAQLIKDYSELQAWILGGKDIYMSFATPGASDANLGIPDGIRFSGKIELFGGAIKSPAIQPKIGWIYKIAQGLYETPGKAKRAAVHDANKGEALTKEEFAAFKKAAGQLRDIVAKEVGLTKKTIEVDYVKPSAKELREFLDSASFTQKESFKLGGLEFTDNHISLVPFKVTSKTKLFGNEEDVELSLKDGKLVLEAKTKIEAIGNTELLLEFDLEKKDFIVVGEYAQNPALQNWLATEIQNGIKQISATADAKFKALNSDLAKAKQLRDDAQGALSAAQKVENAVTQAAVDRLAQTTHGYENDYNQANNEYNGCHGWKKYYCETKWWPRKSLAWDTWKASEQLLEDAKKALSEAKSLAVEVHKAEIKFNQAATTVALAAKDVAAATDIRNIIATGLDSFANDAGRMANVFRLDKAFIAGSLKDVASGKPLVLELYFELNGKKYNEFFALSPTDADFNAVSFGLLPVIAAEHIIDDMEKTLEDKLGPKLGSVGNLSAKLTDWIKAHIYELVGGLRENLEKRIANIEYELTQEESKYRKIFVALDTHAANYLDGYKNLTDESNQILSTYKMTDFMPASQVFKDRYLAVGHSSLCLGVASNGSDVYQQNCKDTDAERWSAIPLGKTQEGYIQLTSKGLCLKASNTGVTSGQPLILAQCNGKDDHEKWKFISQDGEFSKFVNRYSQKCLHFDTVNANAKAGYAVWTSCFGADSEGFREIKDAEKPSFYKVEKMIRARNGKCLATDPDFGKYFTKTAKGQTTSSRSHLLNMQRQMDNALYSAACSADDKALFNYVEAVNGDLKLVHEQSGWCVVPGPRRDQALALTPCDNGKDMYWQLHESGESSFVLRNAQSHGCIDLGARKGRTGYAMTAACQSKPDQVLEFVKD